MIVLSHVHVRPILAARGKGLAVATTSVDLGRSTSEVRLETAGVSFGEGCWLAWEAIAEISENATACFAVVRGVRIRFGRAVYP